MCLPSCGLADMQSWRSKRYHTTELDSHLRVQVGAVLGLAIFNGVLLDVHLPLVTYKKLLRGTPTLADLADAQPSLARGLQALLDYDGDDVADVFCRTFEVEYTALDTVRPLAGCCNLSLP